MVMICQCWLALLSSLVVTLFVTISAEETVLLRDRQNVYTGSIRNYPEAGVFLTQEDDGNLVLRHGLPSNKAAYIIWQTGYFNKKQEYYTRLQSNGALVTRPGTESTLPRAKSVWASWTGGKEADYYMALSEDHTILSIKKGSPGNPKDTVWWVYTNVYYDGTAPTNFYPGPPTCTPVSYPATTLLSEKQEIYTGSIRNYPGSNVFLVQEYSGNLVLKYGLPSDANACILWESKYQGHKQDYYTRLQKNGNLVTRPGDESTQPREKSVWATGTKGNYGDYVFILSEDQKVLSIKKGTAGNPRLPVWSVATNPCHPCHPPVPSPIPISPTPGTEVVLLREGQELYSGSIRNYPNDLVFFTQESNGNVVLWSGVPHSPTASILWESRHRGATGDYFTRLQRNGNLITRPGTESTKPREKSVWATGVTSDKADYFLVLSADRTRIFIKKGTPDHVVATIWSDYTTVHNHYPYSKVSPNPTPVPTLPPIVTPTTPAPIPAPEPTPMPTMFPVAAPTTPAPTTVSTTVVPTPTPTLSPVVTPTTSQPTPEPTFAPTPEPTFAPTPVPTSGPTNSLTTVSPTSAATPVPTTESPTAIPDTTATPTIGTPTSTPSMSPTEPTAEPTPETTTQPPVVTPGQLFTSPIALQCTDGQCSVNGSRSGLNENCLIGLDGTIINDDFIFADPSIAPGIVSGLNGTLEIYGITYPPLPFLPGFTTVCRLRCTGCTEVTS